jgi:hypothetical protein
MLNPVAVVAIKGDFASGLRDLDQDHANGLDVEGIRVGRDRDGLGPDGFEHPGAR